MEDKTKKARKAKKKSRDSREVEKKRGPDRHHERILTSAGKTGGRRRKI